MSAGKQLATLQAAAALTGFALQAIRDDLERRMYVATSGPITLSFSDLAEVQRWLLAVAPAPMEEGHA